MTNKAKKLACCGGSFGSLVLLDAETGEPIPDANSITYIHNSRRSEEAAVGVAKRMAQRLGYDGLWEDQPENEGVEPPFVRQGESA